MFKKEGAASGGQKEKNIFFYRNSGLLDAMAIVAIFLLVFFGIYFIMGDIYKERVIPRVSIGDLDLSGKDRDSLLEILKKRKEDIYANGLNFRYADKEIKIDPLMSYPLAPELSKVVLDIDIDKTADNLLKIGKSGSFWRDLKTRTLCFVYGYEAWPALTMDENEIKDILADSFSEYEARGENAHLKLHFNTPSFLDPSFKKQDDHYVEIIKEQFGKIFDYDLAIDKALEQAENMENIDVEMFLETDYPEIKADDVPHEAIKKISDVLSLAPFYLENGSDKWKVSRVSFGGWLDLVNAGDYIDIGVNKDKVDEYLKTNVSEEVNIEPAEAKFEISGGRVSEFQVGKQGKEIDIEATVQNIMDSISRGEGHSAIAMMTIDPKVTDGNIDNYGIKEIIGIGESDFSGSPVNRIHNIKVGAQMLHGLLIKPGEEFTTINSLGEINAENGYREELVIKGDRTKKEYGGGLCQIGTTVFRAALDSGLPITERRPHSYRVSYYEPAGTDATIYDPHPDLRFLNDTGHYILIQSRVEGNKLYFEFWGTQDGRKVERTEPRIYNIKSPPPKKEIVSDELSPGEKRKVESAHNGADAEFTYKVVYPDGRAEEKVFFSRYVPWPEVWLVGPDPKEETAEEQGSEESGSNEYLPADQN